jgi:hypothetical protein
MPKYQCSFLDASEKTVRTEVLAASDDLDTRIREQRGGCGIAHTRGASRYNGGMRALWKDWPC